MHIHTPPCTNLAHRRHHSMAHYGAACMLMVSMLRAVGVFPFRTNMTRKMKMGYVQLQMQAACNLFPAGVLARGHVYHFSEIVQERVLGGLGAGVGARTAAEPGSSADWHIGYSATMQVPGAWREARPHLSRHSNTLQLAAWLREAQST